MIFRWHKVLQAKIYQMEIFDESLRPLWRSPQIADLTYALPPEIEDKIQRNKTYFWMITAFISDNTKKESSLGSFILKK